MCGICGIIDYKKKVSVDAVRQMMKPMEHRGPDDNGVELFQGGGWTGGFGHVRLSIIDLSPLGHQPMIYDNLTIVFNGEVYNFAEIKTELVAKGHTFKSSSDTEVVLHSFKEWGTDCVNRFIGMFAFAIYDSIEQKIYFCRDRVGVKPFYYYQDDNCFAFGSELKCILSLPECDKTINERALTYYIQLGLIPFDMCILEKAKKLEAGHWAIYDINQKSVSLKKYWDIDDFYSKPKLTISFEEAKEQLRILLKSAFGYRMVSDVPVGVFLSGGFDSSAVASILTQELGIRPKTFTIGYNIGPNEIPDAEAIAKHLGTDHTSHYCTTKDIQDIIPQLPYFYDEPHADISSIPTTLVSKITREHVKVALSADGGDEIFAGYYNYEYLCRFLPVLNRIPKMFKKSSDVPYWLINAIIPKDRTAYKWILDTVHSYYKGDDMSIKGFMKKSLTWEQSVYEAIIKNSVYNCYELYDYTKTAGESIEYLMALEFKTNMRELMLAKVDRASMSVSLEARDPMLDHRIAEFGAQLPIEFKYNKAKGGKKRILKSLVYDYLPKEIMDKPKKGFSIPLGRWLRTDLKEYFYGNISTHQLEETGFKSKEVMKMIDNYMNHGYHYGYMFRGYSDLVWRIFQYLQWYKLWINNK